MKPDLKQIKRILDTARQKFQEAEEARDALLAKHNAVLEGEEGKEPRLLTTEEIAAADSARALVENAAANVRSFQSDYDRALGEESAGARSLGGSNQTGPVTHETQGRFSKEQLRDMGRFSYVRAINSLLKGGSEYADGIEREMSQEAEKEGKVFGKSIEGIGVPSWFMSPQGRNVVSAHARDLTATGQTSNAGDQGGVAIQTDVGQMIPALRPKLMVAQLGATILNGLQGDYTEPRVTSEGTYAWEGETDANTESSPLFDAMSLTPIRLGAFTDVSKQLLAQQNQISEARVRGMLEFQIEKGVDLAALAGTGSGQPEGILNTSGIGDVAGGTNGAVPDFADIIALETQIAVDDADVMDMNYLTTPGMRGLLKAITQDGTNAPFIWNMEGAEAFMNGYRAYVSTQVPNDLDKGTSTGVCHAIIFGNWRNLVLGNWGGLDLVINPYTKSKNAIVEVVANSWWDVDFKHVESFAAMQDALLS